jgi:hypothetical protein
MLQRIHHAQLRRVRIRLGLGQRRLRPQTRWKHFKASVPNYRRWIHFNLSYLGHVFSVLHQMVQLANRHARHAFRHPHHVTARRRLPTLRRLHTRTHDPLPYQVIRKERISLRLSLHPPMKHTLTRRRTTHATHTALQLHRGSPLQVHTCSSLQVRAR